jgi:hypothetical protein
MKKLVIIIILITTYIISCNKYDKVFKRKECKTPLTINYDDKNIGYNEVEINKELFNDNKKFSWLDQENLYSKGRLFLKDSFITILVNEAPVEVYSGDFYLINFNFDYNPIDFIQIRGMENINKTEITKDTIFKYIDYEYSGWVEKYIIDPKGEFKLVEEKVLWEEDYDPN